MEARILALRSFTEVNTPRRIACRSTMPNQTSTRFIQEAWVGRSAAESRPRLADLVDIAHETAAGLGVPCTVDLVDEDRQLEPVTLTRARRVMREALVNAARHAPGAPARIAVRLDGADLSLAISNPLPRANRFGHGTGTGLGRLADWLAEAGGRLDRTQMHDIDPCSSPLDEPCAGKPALNAFAITFGDRTSRPNTSDENRCLRR
jgi:hypothetical protein